MEAGLRRWVEETTGAAVTHAERGFSGGSRELWFVEVGSRRLVLRVETGAGAFHGTPLTLGREAAVCRSLLPTPVPVPAVVAVSDDATAVLLERVPGTADLRKLDASDGPALVASFMGALGALHRLDVDELDLPGLLRPTQPAEHALHDLELWDGLVRAHRPDPHPLLVFGSAWLRENAPSTVPRTVLVHGDAGPGNFLYDGTEVTGLIDWEMSHLGDPMDDLAWLDVRAGASAPWGDVARRDLVYEKASGLPVDGRSIAYYRVFVYLRCAVTTALAIGRGGGALGIAPYHAPHHRFLVQLAGALGEAAGLPLVGIEPLAMQPSPLYDRLIDDLRTAVLPELEDRAAKLAARSAVLVLEHARAQEQLGPQLADLERRDLLATFGNELSQADLSAVCREAASAGPAPEVLGYLLRRAQRGLVPWATSAGEDVTPAPSPRTHG